MEKTNAQKDVPNRPILAPFNFTSNWVYRNGMYQPKDKNLAALEGDVLITYYIIGGKDDDRFGINERLLTIEECYSPTTSNWIRSGKATRRVIGQRRKAERTNREKMIDDHSISRELDIGLRTYGYHYDGMCREFGHVARRYTGNTGNTVSVVFPSTNEPFYVVREPLPGARPKPTAEQPKIANPLKLVGKRNLITIDDVTMKETKTMVEIPSF